MLEPKDSKHRREEDDLLMGLFVAIESFRMYRHDIYLTQASSSIRRIKKLRKEMLERTEAGFSGDRNDESE